MLQFNHAIEFFCSENATKHVRKYLVSCCMRYANIVSSASETATTGICFYIYIGIRVVRVMNYVRLSTRHRSVFVCKCISIIPTAHMRTYLYVETIANLSLDLIIIFCQFNMHLQTLSTLLQQTTHMYLKHMRSNLLITYGELIIFVLG